MALIKNNALVEDAFVDASHAEGMPEHGAVIVSLEQWQARRDELAARGTPLGIRLRSDQTPALVADDLERFALVALEFPRFRDGRAYSYARLLRERYGFKGELRAVGNVLRDQLVFMLRCGFDSFEVANDKAAEAWREAVAEFTQWYQPTGNSRASLGALRRGASHKAG
jgi:uncharacterized protein (DUF934 family)